MGHLLADNGRICQMWIISNPYFVEMQDVFFENSIYKNPKLVIWNVQSVIPINQWIFVIIKKFTFGISYRVKKNDNIFPKYGPDISTEMFPGTNDTTFYGGGFSYFDFNLLVR